MKISLYGFLLFRISAFIFVSKLEFCLEHDLSADSRARTGCAGAEPGNLLGKVRRGVWRSVNGLTALAVVRALRHARIHWSRRIQWYGQWRFPAQLRGLP